MSQTITFIIGGGKIESEASGFKGKTCASEIAKFTSALGGKVEHAENKPEFYQAAGGTNINVGGTN